MEIRLNGRLQRALVAVLAGEMGKIVPTERLIDALWGVCPPASARIKVQGCVSAVRKQFSGAKRTDVKSQWPLYTRDPGYLFSPDDVTVDLLDYRVLIQMAAQEMGVGRFEAASNHFSAALSLWRGPAYADTHSRVLSAMAAALESGRLLVLERKAECDLQLGRNDLVIEELRLVLAANPLRERMRGVVMLALYRSNCRADALELYRAGHALMREELGIGPGSVLRRLHELILCGSPQLALPGVLADLNEATLSADL
jgi:DNA-binding SARP family transcriptional activator